MPAPDHAIAVPHRRWVGDVVASHYVVAGVFDFVLGMSVVLGGPDGNGGLASADTWRIRDLRPR